MKGERAVGAKLYVVIRVEVVSGARDEVSGVTWRVWHPYEVVTEIRVNLHIEPDRINVNAYLWLPAVRVESSLRKALLGATNSEAYEDEYSKLFHATQ